MFGGVRSHSSAIFIVFAGLAHPTSHVAKAAQAQRCCKDIEGILRIDTSQLATTRLRKHTQLRRREYNGYCFSPSRCCRRGTLLSSLEYRNGRFFGVSLTRTLLRLQGPKGAKQSAMQDEVEEELDLYQEVKGLEKQLEFVELQEEYLKDEMRHLQRELLRAKEEIRRIQSVPLVIGQFNEMIDANYGIVSSTAGSNYYVRILSTLDRELLKPNTSIALHRHSHSVVDILPPESDSTVKLMTEKPKVSYKDIGGLDIQKQEVREAIELPLIQHHLYQQIGIDPPRGVLLYGRYRKLFDLLDVVQVLLF